MSFLKEFRDFAIKGNMLDMAIGIVIGAAFTTIVSSMVDDIITPPLGLILGGVDFSDLFIKLRDGNPPGPYQTLAAARAAGADHVIPFMHWGWEKSTQPDNRQRSLARRLIDEGASLVVGSHPHVTQGAEIYRGKPIVYSLGNFIFDGYVEVANRTGWLLNVVLNQQGVQRWDIDVVRMDRDAVPHPTGRRLHQPLGAPQP